MKIRVLFVISHLVQGGSERFTYEVLKAIDRERFEPVLLTKRRRRVRDYYDALIAELGVPIIRKLPIFYGRVRHHARPLFRLLRHPLEALHRFVASMRMGNLFDQFDLICPVQIENYYLLQPLLEDNEKVITFLMSNAFQYKVNPYRDCIPGRRYRFTVFDRRLIDDWRGEPCSNAEAIHFPLCMDLSGRPDLSKSARRVGRPRIGVFIRLSRERSFSGLFQAFRDVVAQTDAELWVYGRGNPAMFHDELVRLGIDKHVVFKGHAVSIADTLRKGELSLVWMTCFDETLGYASVEVASLGFPMLFWNLGRESSEEIAAHTGGALRSHREPQQLAQATLDDLGDPEGAALRGRLLRYWVTETYDIRRHIEALQERMEDIVRENRSRAGEPEYGSARLSVS